MFDARYRLLKAMDDRWLDDLVISEDGVEWSDILTVITNTRQGETLMAIEKAVESLNGLIQRYKRRQANLVKERAALIETRADDLIEIDQELSDIDEILLRLDPEPEVVDDVAPTPEPDNG